MKCQCLLSGKNKENISNVSSGELLVAQRVVIINPGPAEPRYTLP